MSTHMRCNYMSCASLWSQAKNTHCSTQNDCSVLCLRASWKGCNKGLSGNINKLFRISCPIEQSVACLPPPLAMGSLHRTWPLQSSFGMERTRGTVRGAGTIPDRSASVRDWQCFLQFPFPWATSSNQIQSSPHYLPLVSLIVIWKYVAKESKNHG